MGRKRKSKKPKKKRPKKKRNAGKAAAASKDRMDDRVARATVDSAVSKLQRDGDVVMDGDKVMLTEKGAELAEAQARARGEAPEQEAEVDSEEDLPTDSKALLKGDGKNMIVGPDGEIVPISEELADKLQTAGDYAKTEDFDLEIDPDELDLTDEEKVLWAKSPAAVVGARVQQGDQRFIEFMAQLYEHREARKEQEDHTLDHYRHIQEMIARTEKSAKRKAPKMALENRLVWSFLRQAKVFNIDLMVYSEIYRACDIYVNEEVVGDKWIPPPPIVDGKMVMQPMPEGHTDAKEYVRKVKEAAQKAAVPDRYPFDIIYIGFGEGISLTMEQFLTKFSADEKTAVDIAKAGFAGATLIGALVTATGYVTEFYAVRRRGKSAMYMLNMLRTPDEGWIPTYDLGPWYIPKVIEFINKNRTFIAEVEQDEEQKRRSKRTHRDTSKSKTKILWIPPPYYRLQIRDTLIEEKTRDIFENPPTGKKISYRHDVRGHERYFIRRGPLPLKDKDRAKLQARKYTIYEHTQPSSDHMAGMLKRGLPPKKSSEWMAIKIVWIDSHISPSNEELPYVPALRTTGKAN